MYAYIAINGNDETGKLYATRLTLEELAESVDCYKTFEAAAKALEPYQRKEPTGIINVGYVRFRAKPAEPEAVSAAASEPETPSEPEPEIEAEPQTETETP